MVMPMIDVRAGEGTFTDKHTLARRASRVAVVGGGNSAGQAAVWLARGGALVTLIHRRADLRETMSDYLIRPNAASPRSAKDQWPCNSSTPTSQLPPVGWDERNPMRCIQGRKAVPPPGRRFRRGRSAARRCAWRLRTVIGPDHLASRLSAG